MIYADNTCEATRSHCAKRPFPQKDPLLEDALLASTALCAEVIGSAEAIAEAGEMSPRWAQDLRQNGARGGFLHRMTVFTYRLAARRANHAWAVVAHFKATAKQALMPISDADLVERFWELLESENEYEGRENAATARFARTADLEALKRASLAEAAIQEEVCAVIEEMQRRRLNPMTFGDHR